MATALVHEAMIFGAAVGAARVLPHPSTSPVGRPYRRGEPPACGPKMSIPAGETFCMDEGAYCVGMDSVSAAGETPCPNDPGCDLACKREIEKQFGRLWYNFGPCQHVYPGSGCPVDPARIPRAKRDWERARGVGPLGAQLPRFPLPPVVPTPGWQGYNCNINGIVVACPPTCVPPACTVIWQSPNFP